MLSEQENKALNSASSHIVRTNEKKLRNNLNYRRKTCLGKKINDVHQKDRKCYDENNCYPKKVQEKQDCVVNMLNLVKLSEDQKSKLELHNY